VALTARSLHVSGSVRLQSYFHRSGEPVNVPARDLKRTLEAVVHYPFQLSRARPLCDFQLAPPAAPRHLVTWLACAIDYLPHQP
jgi:hypothetical protein